MLCVKDPCLCLKGRFAYIIKQCLRVRETLICLVYRSQKWIQKIDVLLILWHCHIRPNAATFIYLLLSHWRGEDITLYAISS